MLQDALAQPADGDRRAQRRDRARGRGAGVPTPLHAAIAALVAGLEAGWSDCDGSSYPLSDGELHLPADALLTGRCPAGVPRRRRADGRQLRRLPRRTPRPRRRDRRRHRRRRDPGAADRHVPRAPARGRRGARGRRHGGLHPPALRPRRLGDRRRDALLPARRPTTPTRSTGATGRARRHPETGPGREDFGAIPAPERLAPLADSIVLHEGERSEIVPGVVLRLAPGHTPGHCIVESPASTSCSPTPPTTRRSC